jgi:hypothetical protein
MFSISELVERIITQPTPRCLEREHANYSQFMLKIESSKKEGVILN